MTLIQKKYEHSPTLSPTFCPKNGSPKDTEYLKKTFAIEFVPNAPHLPTPSRNILEEMEDLSDVSLEPLDQLLQQFELDGSTFETPREKMQRLFYACLCTNLQTQKTNDTILLDSDTNYLSDISLKIWNKEAPSKLDSYKLMHLAYRARPKEKFILQTLVQMKKYFIQQANLINNVLDRD